MATPYREKGIRRVIMVDAATGADLAPTATRRTGGPETWLTSPEPSEPLVTSGCTFGGGTDAGMRLVWGDQFSLSVAGDTRVVRTYNTAGPYGNWKLKDMPFQARL